MDKAYLAFREEFVAACEDEFYNFVSNPVFTDSEGDRQFGASSKNVVQIEFNGIVSEEAARVIAEELSRVIDAMEKKLGGDA